MATGEFLESFVAHYKIAESSTLGTKSCGICHVSDSDFAFNPFGKDVKKTLAGKETLEAGTLDAVAALDSDGDGTDNGKEIAAGTDPADPKVGGSGKVSAPAPVEEEKPATFPPKNGFHPAIVHFPIALFVAALILDFFGMIRKDKTLLHAGWYNMVLAAVTSIGGIMSGILAVTLMKLPYRGLILNHLVYAVGSSAIMGIMIAMRVHRHEKMNVSARTIYYLLATVGFVMISYAGHLGGVFVYGE